MMQTVTYHLSCHEVSMRLALIACLAALPVLAVLAACVPAPVYYAEGVTLAAREQDLGRCNAQAFASYPVRNVTRYRPRVFVPGTQSCDAAGVCTVTPPYWRGGEAYTVDVNAEARRAGGVACMGERGYARISLPRCAEGTVIQPTTTMPPLTGGTCIWDQTGGVPVVANPI